MFVWFPKVFVVFMRCLCVVLGGVYGMLVSFSKVFVVFMRCL